MEKTNPKNIKETLLYKDVIKFLEETNNLELKRELELVLEKLSKIGIPEKK